MRILSFTFHEELGLSTQPRAMGAQALAIILGCLSLKSHFQLIVGPTWIFQNYKLYNHISSIRHGPQRVAVASTHGAQMHVLIIPADTY